MKATAVLGAAGRCRVRPDLDLPRRGLPNLQWWRPDAVPDHQQTTRHGWVGGCGRAGRSRAIGRPENARPLLAG